LSASAVSGGSVTGTFRSAGGYGRVTWIGRATPVRRSVSVQSRAAVVASRAASGGQPRSCSRAYRVAAARSRDRVLAKMRLMWVLMVWLLRNRARAMPVRSASLVR
jgi:hypothetical protein